MRFDCRSLFVYAFLAWVAFASVAAQPVGPGRMLAFPGAEGAGRFATGGRGGDVYHVTTLDDDGPGSLRHGIVTAEGPRTIVFEASGMIALASPLVIDKSRLTIAGQTSPGDGITLRGHGIELRGVSDVIVRFLRIRPAARRGPAILAERVNHVILDHLSASWGAGGIYQLRRAFDLTVQWSILSEALGASKTTDEATAEPGDRVSLLYNVFASNGSWLPPGVHTAAAVARLEFRNNVVYNSSASLQAGVHAPAMVDNVWLAGPESPASAGAAGKATALYEFVMGRAGASVSRDMVDRRVLADVRAGTGKTIGSPDEVGGWLYLRPLPARPDTDRDGMPDAWERNRGLDPNTPDDRNGDHDRDGFTNLEEYLDDSAQPVTTAAFRPPYPPSPVIASVTFDDSTERIEAEGSDIWPITWAENDQLYAAWGDGGGFGGTNTIGRVKLGVARVEGGKRDYEGINLAGGRDALRPAPCNGKSEGILALGNTLYLWRDNDREAGRPEYFLYWDLWRSDDFGLTWRATGVRFSTQEDELPPGDAGMFAPAFCQFGRGYTGARDDYVYIYAPDIIDPSHWRVREPGRINLMRVPRAKIESKDAYEFHAGLEPNGQPRWIRDPGARRPVWEDQQGTHRIAVSYNAGLKRFLLTTITIDRRGWMSIYDAPNPWGPWTHVHTEFNQERWGGYAIIFTFVNKWLSADGRDFVLVHTKDDRWASIEGRFDVKE
jgi:hypothetical protein